MLLGKPPYELVWLALTVLAVWRLTALIAYEAGPFGVLVTLRRGLVGIGLGSLVGCFYCLSFWISFAAVLVFPLSRDTPLVILGVAGAVAIIERALTGSPTTGESDERDVDEH
jgi:hypothetical protein